MDFRDCVRECLRNPEFLVEYDRLNGTSFSERLTPIEEMIDLSSGKRGVSLRE